MTASALDRLKSFLSHEATAGLLLAAAATAAIFCANVDGLSVLYDDFLTLRASVSLGPLALSKPLILWINDGLMAVFFCLVGLEIKREFLEGHLSEKGQLALPAIAAAGGMAVPALVYCAVVWNEPGLLRGWAIPAATDIAFALGALSLLGGRVPMALKVFLLTLATLDDLGAIAVIALFYTANLSTAALALAALAILALAALNRLGADRAALYVIAGLALWVFVLKSGVHATLAGVALGLAIPLRRRDGRPMLHEIEEGLHPYVTYLILPLFAFANAGVPLTGLGFADLVAPLPLAIALGLILGKPVGVVAAALLARATGLARLPEGVAWTHYTGAACLAGIGFTMSLFIGTLAFEDAASINAVRLGVIAGSLVSMAAGLAILAVSPKTNAGD